MGEESKKIAKLQALLRPLRRNSTFLHLLSFPIHKRWYSLILHHIFPIDIRNVRLLHPTKPWVGRHLSRRTTQIMSVALHSQFMTSIIRWIIQLYCKSWKQISATKNHKICLLILWFSTDQIARKTFWFVQYSSTYASTPLAQYLNIQRSVQNYITQLLFVYIFGVCFDLTIDEGAYSFTAR